MRAGSRRRSASRRRPGCGKRRGRAPRPARARMHARNGSPWGGQLPESAPPAPVASRRCDALVSGLLPVAKPRPRSGALRSVARQSDRASRCVVCEGRRTRAPSLAWRSPRATRASASSREPAPGWWTRSSAEWPSAALPVRAHGRGDGCTASGSRRSARRSTRTRSSRASMPRRCFPRRGGRTGCAPTGVLAASTRRARARRRLRECTLAPPTDLRRDLLTGLGYRDVGWPRTTTSAASARGRARGWRGAAAFDRLARARGAASRRAPRADDRFTACRPRISPRAARARESYSSGATAEPPGLARALATHAAPREIVEITRAASAAYPRRAVISRPRWVRRAEFRWVCPVAGAEPRAQIRAELARPAGAVRRKRLRP